METGLRGGLEWVILSKVMHSQAACIVAVISPDYS